MVEPTNQTMSTAKDEQRLSAKVINARLGNSLAKVGPAFMRKVPVERRRTTTNSASQPVFYL